MREEVKELGEARSQRVLKAIVKSFYSILSALLNDWKVLNQGVIIFHYHALKRSLSGYCKRKRPKQRHQVGDLMLSSLETFVAWMTVAAVEIPRNGKMQDLFSRQN